MISSETEYQKAREELDYLTRWLARLESSDAPRRKGITCAGIVKKISRIQKEVAEFEANRLPARDDGRMTDAPRDRN